MTYCSICKKKYSSNYCPNCGQRKVDSKITFTTFIKDIFDNIFAFDKSLYTNIKYLILNPFKIINNYLDGYRGYYSSPGKLFVFASILVAIGFSLTNVHFFNFHIVKSDIQEQFLFLFLFIFLLSFLSYLVYYIKWKKTFTEHVIINIYNISLWTLFFTPLAIVDYLYINNKLVSKLFLYLFILLIIIWNNRAFKINSIWKRIGYITINLTLFLIFILSLEHLT